jgi:hypothetical protein
LGAKRLINVKGLRPSTRRQPAATGAFKLGARRKFFSGLQRSDKKESLKVFLAHN